MLTYRFARHHQVLLKYQDKTPQLFFVTPPSPVILQALQQSCTQPLTLTQVSQSQLMALFEQHYKGQETDTSEAVQALSEEIDLNALRADFSQAGDLLDYSDENAPIVRLINAILTEAIKKKASDIHFESFEHRIAVRVRLDGVLQTLMQPPVELAPFLISRIKVMAGLDIAEKRLPQDGRISTRIAGRAVDVRVSVIPVANHERVVMRILDKAASSFTLQSLAMPPAIRGAVTKVIQQTDGLFLVVGPTGSGKTTTLYAALSALDIAHKNIMTVEEPIEYFLDGISQTQVNNKVGMNFSTGLRSILRQDPDIIMVGEIRDKETAAMAIQASLTGHLVFSTLHTNTALGAVLRLKDMGIESFLIASSLSAVLSQRLLRKLCPACKLPAAETSTSLALLGRGQRHYQAHGCQQCAGVGYQGRMGIYELLLVDNSLRELIDSGSSEQQMQNYLNNRYQTLQQSGIELVKSGLTSLEELLRVSTLSAEQ